MKKIPSLFKRNYDGDRLIYNEVVVGCEWVIAGEGVATRKYDGTACMILDGELYARRTVKLRSSKPYVFTLQEFIPAQEPDEVTGHWPGWVKCDRTNPQWKWHFKAFDTSPIKENGTYELCGPKVQKDPEHYGMHILVPHARAQAYLDCPRDFECIREWLKGKDIEGIVWHHYDGRMCKIKKRDFGMKRSEFEHIKGGLND